jgi:voltage-gated potassium channel
VNTNGRLVPGAGRFDLALIGIILVIATTAAADKAGVVRWFGLAIQAGVLLFVLRTAGVRRPVLTIAQVLTAVALVVGTVGVFTAGATGDRVSEVVSLLLVVAAPPAIVIRVSHQSTVDGVVIGGAVCLYLLAGLFFAVSYSLMDGLTGGQFFVQEATPSHVDFTYFSFVTLATVGYGDLTPAGDMGRITAITEALMGQLYLVTVVALAVSRAGSQRERLR